MTRNILSAKDFSREDIIRIFNVTYGLEQKVELNKHHALLANRKGIGLLFFEESFRTNNSFRNAMLSLGGKILVDIERDGVFSSFGGATNKKGESLESAIENFCYPTIGALVIRHPKPGSAQIAADIANRYGISVINAGDGDNEHPTQALLDLYTMWKVKDQQLDDVRIVFCNDLEKSRTIHSLCQMLCSNFQVKRIGICAPEDVDLPEYLKQLLEEKGIDIIRFGSIKEAAGWADFIYMTRPQKERYLNKDGEIDEEALLKFKSFQIDKETMDYIGEEDCFVLHPQPIDSVNFNEITLEAQKHPNCIIMIQSHNGTFIRMALLRMILAPE